MASFSVNAHPVQGQRLPIPMWQVNDLPGVYYQYQVEKQDSTGAAHP